MSRYLHRYSGILPAGDVFSFGWYSDTGLAVDAVHALSTLWLTDVWSGVGGSDGLDGYFTAGVVVQKITTNEFFFGSPARVSATRETDVTVPGVAVGNSLPQDTSIVVSLRTEVPGPSGRGRIYLPAPVATSLTATGELAAATITSMLASLHNAWAATSAAGLTPIVFSRTSGVFNPILRYGIGNVFDRQTRRVNKVITARSFTNMP